jgi:hypothetical protein
MDIVVVAITIIGALLVPRTKAVALAAVAWIFGLSMVAWGPAHNSNVHLDSIGFWGPWLILLGICMALVFGIQALKRRWARPRESGQPAA